MAKVLKEEFNKKAQEITETNNKLKENILIVEKKKKDLDDRLNRIISDREKYYKKICELNVLVEKRKEKKQQILSQVNGDEDKSKGNYSNNMIDKSISDILDNIIGPKFDEYEINTNLFYIVKSEQDTLKKLTDYTQTFGKLKIEYCEQNNILLNEIYFADDQGKIFLDSMVIKECLFPLDNLILKEYRPVIKVIFTKKEQENNKLETIEDFVDDKNKKESKENASKISLFFKNNIFTMIHFIILIIYIFLWIFNLVKIRDIQSNVVVKETFDMLKNTYFNRSMDVSKI